jgi:hypothetical protein
VKTPCKVTVQSQSSELPPGYTVAVCIKLIIGDLPAHDHEILSRSSTVPLGGLSGRITLDDEWYMGRAEKSSSP